MASDCHGPLNTQSMFILLPFGMETDESSTDVARRRDLEEKGPFGRSTRRRGFSRSKTGTPARKEDIQRLENMQAEDAIFNNYKANQRAREPLPSSKSAPLISLDANATAMMNELIEKEATEVMLYGYGRDMEWAAIDHYERVSSGSILEDYDRHAPGQRYDLARSLTRSASQRNLSKAALKKRNTYKGGAHWIKVTFDSPEAADLACDRSPHIIHGYLVYAEPFRGVGPPDDSPIPATTAGAQIDSQSLPTTFSTATLSQGRQTESPTSSNTVSTATVGAPDAAIPMKSLKPSNNRAPTRLAHSSTMPSLNPFSNPSSASQPSSSSAVASQDSQVIRQRPMRIQGAKRAVLRSADQALLPSQPRAIGVWALLLSLLSLGSSSNINNNNNGVNDSSSSQIPRLEDGNPDWAKAGWYWLIFAWLDKMLGTDMCGLQSDE